MKEADIKALIHLLDDPDPKINQHIQQKLIESGISSLPFLEEAWESEMNPHIQQKLENLIHKLQFEHLKNALNFWKEKESDNLLEGVIIIAQYYYPYLKKEEVEQKIDTLVRDIWVELNEELTPLEKIKVINHVLFDIHQFKGNKQHFHSPQNSFINSVLETKTGNPLSLSILYSIIAQKLNIPIYGINLPEHFILGYKNTKEGFSFIDEEMMLFYINAFNKGAVFTRNEIEIFIQRLNLEKEESYFKACNNLETILRLLNNLENAYKQSGETSKELEIKEIKSILVHKKRERQ